MRITFAKFFSTMFAVALLIGNPLWAISQSSGAGAYGSSQSSATETKPTATATTQMVSGAIVSTDLQKKTLKLRTSDGKEKDFTVDTSTQFGKPATMLSDLKAGQQVTLTANASNQVSKIELAAPATSSAASSSSPMPSSSASPTRPLPSQSPASSQPATNQGVNPYGAGAAAQSSARPDAGAPTQATARSDGQALMGTITSVDQTNRTITVRTSDRDLARSITSGQQVSFWAKASGSSVEGLRDPGRSGQTPSRGNEPYGQAKSEPAGEQFSGSLLSNDPNSSTLTLRVDGHSALTKFTAGQELDMLVAVQAPGASRAPVSGSAGSGTVSSSSQSSATQPASERIMGTITAVSPMTNKVTIRTKDGQTKEVTVDYNTRYSLTSAGGTIADLKTGQEINMTTQGTKATAIESSTTPTTDTVK